jgi:cephalosporin hydroxylase
MSLELKSGRPERADAYTPAQVATAIAADASDPCVDAFHRRFYGAFYTWPMVRYKGVPLLKNPLDLHVYHEILWQLQPALVIETGTCFGGSALWFADQLAPWGGRVLSIDIKDKRDSAICVNDENAWPLVEHDRVRFLVGDSLSRETVAEATHEAAEALGPVMVSLDADHHADHVLRELDLYAPLATTGSYCVVEDTNVSGRPIAADDPGPGAAVDAWLEYHPGFSRNALCERFLLTFSPGGWLYRHG